MSISSDFRKEGYGHTSLRTTENYLDTYEDDTLVENANKLLAFKDKKQ